MKVEVQASGGVTGARLGGVLDTATLDGDLAQRVEAALTPPRLDAASSRTATPMPDQRQWTVSVEGRQYDVSEAQLDDDQVSALDAMVTELARRRRGER